MDALFPPGPQKSLILGDAPHFKNNPLDFMQQAARAYGDLVHFRFGPSHAYLLTNPRDAHYVLVERDDLFSDQPSFLRALNSAMGHDLFAPKDGVKKRPTHRASFRPEWLDGMIDGMAQAAATRLDAWQGGDLLPLLEPLALELVAGTLFGHVEGNHVAAALERAIGAQQHEGRFRSPLTPPAWIPTAHNRQRTRAARDLRRWSLQALAQYRVSGPLLSALVSSAANDTQAAEELVALFRAGRFAVAQTIARAWSLLAEHPEAADALDAEVETVLGGRLPTAADLPYLTYCELVFKETLRLQPPVMLLSRQARKETRLGEYYAPAGSTIFVSPYIIHHSPRHYASPEHFLPERFGESFARRGSRCAYLPFGAGAFAEAEHAYATTLGKLILALTAQRSRSTAAAAPATTFKASAT